jgi:hypothetical protein
MGLSNHLVVLMHSEGGVVDMLVVPVDSESAGGSSLFTPG